ncbi:uncharacterized protein [Solanum tuberosum]|uniref:uncharacterized protein n=1 Tax=Solanum tuberosum TaxID=4113 RepID=UPI00073A49DF|nr:PREDICTED: uncharacterized protein LOC107060540 [Solanum tuberosum]
MLVKFLKEYTPSIVTKVVIWRKPEVGSYKCNTNGASKGNPRPSSSGFCVRDSSDNFIYAKLSRLLDGNNLIAEAKVLITGLEFCILAHYTQVEMEIDSLTMKNVLKGIWEVPWEISLEVKKFKELRNNCVIRVEHVFREGNHMVDYFAKMFLNDCSFLISNWIEAGVR